MKGKPGKPHPPKSRLEKDMVGVMEKNDLKSISATPKKTPKGKKY